MSKVIIVCDDFEQGTLGYSGQIIGKTVQSGYFSIVNLDIPYNKEGHTGVLVDLNCYRSFPELKDVHGCDCNNDDLLSLYLEAESCYPGKFEGYLEKMIDILESDESETSKQYVIDSINLITNFEVIKSKKIINFLIHNLDP